MNYISRRSAQWALMLFNVDDRDADKIYTKGLAELVIRANRRADEAPEESPAHSPWMHAQEWDVRAVRIDVDDLGGGAALGMARYRNFAEEDPKLQILTYDLRETPEGWRIADIVFPEAVLGLNRLSEPLKSDLADTRPAPQGSLPSTPKAVTEMPRAAQRDEFFEALFGPGPATNNASAAAPVATMPTPPPTKSGIADRPPLSGSQAARNSAKFKPLVPGSPIVTRGRCHMDECSWAKWMFVDVKPMPTGEVRMDITLLGGSSPIVDRKRRGVAWSKRPHSVTVLCSYSQPSISVGGQKDVLSLKPNERLPGFLTSSENLYFEACHSDMNEASDRAAKYGYNVDADG
ncbi:hypothetical protein [Methylobacterium segetis]|uniref:hypothetical protein n=1 Tax=Methylobacterium segetis TaxID=2488750 RepID=UPI001048FA89|nr:hypothetical protein [Methylobacterium segetis]